MEWLPYYNYTFVYVGYTWDYIYTHYLDLYYLSWVAWVVYPIVVTFLLPVVILLLVYGSAMFLHFYRLRHHLRDVLYRGKWDAARQTLAVFWDAQGKIWHGYEVIGLEKIPYSGPALIIYYHGAIPIDIYYVMAKLLLRNNRQLRAIGDRFLFRIPGFKLLMDVMCVMPGTVTGGVDLMLQGHLLAIAPGGVREAYFSDEYYGLLWGKRVGFAKIALEAKVPVIPMFTQNCREAFRSLGLFKGLLRKLYEKTRLPLVPIFGGFPVKLRTFIGDPIPYDPRLTPEELAEKVQNAVKTLIRQHQLIPGNLLRALLERFYTPDHCKPM